MSDFPDERAQVEIRRWLAESDKFVAEQRKLMAEAAKYEKEHCWFPWLQLIALVVSSAGIGALVARLIQ